MSHSRPILGHQNNEHNISHEIDNTKTIYDTLTGYMENKISEQDTLNTLAIIADDNIDAFKSFSNAEYWHIAAAFPLYHLLLNKVNPAPKILRELLLLNNFKNFTPVHCILKSGSLENFYIYQTALINACDRGIITIDEIRSLLKSENFCRYNPLHQAVCSGSFAIVKAYIHYVKNCFPDDYEEVIVGLLNSKTQPSGRQGCKPRCPAHYQDARTINTYLAKLRNKYQKRLYQLASPAIKEEEDEKHDHHYDSHPGLPQSGDEFRSGVSYAIRALGRTDSLDRLHEVTSRADYPTELAASRADRSMSASRQRESKVGRTDRYRSFGYPSTLFSPGHSSDHDPAYPHTTSPSPYSSSSQAATHAYRTKRLRSPSPDGGEYETPLKKTRVTR